MVAQPVLLYLKRVIHKPVLNRLIALSQGGLPVIKLVEAAPRPGLLPNNPKTVVQLALLYLKRVIHKPVLNRLIAL
jgi:hypothetical protein